MRFPYLLIENSQSFQDWSIEIPTNDEIKKKN